MKKIQIFVDKIHPCIIVKDIIQCLITSCGFAFLIIYFFVPQEELTMDVFYNATISMFVIELVICSFCSVSTGRWFEHKRRDNVITTVDEESKYKRGDYEDEEYEGKEMDSIHEAGHAIMTLLTGTEDFSIFLNKPRLERVKRIITAEDVKSSILICYAGSAAEEIVYGNGNTNFGCMSGPNSDYIQAREFIKAYIVMNDKTVSKSFLESELSDKIVTYSKKFYQMAIDDLSDHRDAIEIVAQELVKKKRLTRTEIVNLLGL